MHNRRQDRIREARSSCRCGSYADAQHDPARPVRRRTLRTGMRAVAARVSETIRCRRSRQWRARPRFVVCSLVQVAPPAAYKLPICAARLSKDDFTKNALPPEISKNQIPSSREIPSPNNQINRIESARLEFADWCFLGAWDLRFGYSTTASRLGFARSPKIAVPTLTSVAPSSTAML